MTKADTLLLRAAIELARKAREHGNHPFGTVLADLEGNILLQAENALEEEARKVHEDFWTKAAGAC